MRVNEETVLVGRRAVLVPYRSEHVGKYHQWMSDAEIREQTASEPLSLEEEHAMQVSWHLDADKLTFIVLSREEDIPVPGDAESQDEVAQFLSSCRMAGDVNLFLSLSQREDEEDDSNASAALSFDAELEVMIAEPSERRKGLAREALSLLVHYASSTSSPSLQEPSCTESSSSPLPLDAQCFLVKIGLDNSASISLFNSMGMRKVKVSQVWREVEMRWPPGVSLPSVAPQKVLRWTRP